MPDAFDIDDGALGLEAIWTWSVGSFVLNDQAARPEWVRLERITGLFDGPDHDTPADKRAGRTGETPRPASAGGKTVVLEGEVRSQTLAGLRSRSRALRKAFAVSQTEGTMSIAPHASVGGPTGTFGARPLALTMDEVQAVGYYRRGFSLSLRLSDPRVYFPSLAVSSSHASAVTVTNLGSAPADPIITVTVPAALPDIVLTDGTRTLTIPDVFALPLTVNFRERTVTQTDGTTYPVALNLAASGWWDAFVEGIAAGATVTITQTGGSALTVAFTPSAW